MIHFFLTINKSCQTRFSRYYQNLIHDRPSFELQVARQCITRKSNQTLFFFMEGYKIVYRVYASLYFIIGCDSEDNEFSLLELIQFCVESLDRHFDKVTELDFLFNLEKVHMIMEEIIVKGLIMETNHKRVLDYLESKPSQQSRLD